MDNSNKIILDLCGGTGAWSKPYKDDGFTIYNITLPNYDVKDWSVYCGIFIFPHFDYFQNIPRFIHIRLEQIYGILSAPPCTMFSIARSRAKTSRDLKQGMELVIACLNIIWQCRYNTKLKFWCLENPMGYLRQFLGKPVMTFNPCDFGDPYTKKTDLWGYFNIPKKKPCKLTEKQKWDSKQNNLSKYPRYSDITGSKQVDKRAITPQGFAKAFYEANK